MGKFYNEETVEKLERVIKPLASVATIIFSLSILFNVGRMCEYDARYEREYQQLKALHSNLEEDALSRRLRNMRYSSYISISSKEDVKLRIEVAKQFLKDRQN